MKEKQLFSEKRATTAMRIYRPPLPAAMESLKGKPAFLSCEGVRRQVLAFAGPWKTKGGWWSESAWAREEWDVELRTLRPMMRVEGSPDVEGEAALYRVYKDLRAKGWFVEGIYD
jgi:hypothetical protein